jgi:small-conductance mechanosensitive channel
MADARETEKELSKQLENVVARIGKVERQLKALRRHTMEGPKGKPGAGFIAGKERMIEAAEVTKELDALKQREQEIRAKLQSGNH